MCNGLCHVGVRCVNLRHQSMSPCLVFLLTCIFAGVRKMFAFGSHVLRCVSVLNHSIRLPPWSWGCPSYLSHAWCGMVPTRVEVEVFLWLALADKISTVNNLRRRGIMSKVISDICVLCGNEEESINHFASFIWHFFLNQEMWNFMVYAKEFY